MLDFQAIRLLHRHGNGEYAAMVERAEHSAAAHDPERQWIKGTRIFGCATCSDEIVVQPATETERRGAEPERLTSVGSVLVRSEDVGRRAGVADRDRRVQVAERDRQVPIRVQALDVIATLTAGIDANEPPERAALDPMRREVRGIGQKHVDGHWQGHERVGRLGWRVAHRLGTDENWPETSTGVDGATIVERY